MVGDATANLKLSQARAQSVITDLVSRHGIAAARLVASAPDPGRPWLQQDRRRKGQEPRVELVEVATK